MKWFISEIQQFPTALAISTRCQECQTPDDKFLAWLSESGFSIKKRRTSVCAQHPDRHQAQRSIPDPSIHHPSSLRHEPLQLAQKLTYVLHPFLGATLHLERSAVHIGPHQHGPDQRRREHSEGESDAAVWMF